MFDIDTGQMADEIAMGTDPDWENWSTHPNPELCRHMLAAQIKAQFDWFADIIRRLTADGEELPPDTRTRVRFLGDDHE